MITKLIIHHNKITNKYIPHLFYNTNYIMNNIKAVVFDMDGVLRIGNQLILGTEKLLENLEKKNIKTMIVTNECRYTENELREDLEEIGLIVPDSTIFYTAAMSIRDYFENKIKRFPNKKFNIGIVGELGLFMEINKLNKYTNFKYTDSLSDVNSNDLYLIIGTVNKIKINHLDKILKWIKKGAKVLITCMDACDPSSKGDFTLGMPNHMLHMVGYNIKTKTYSTGKPHPIFKEKIMNSLNNIKEDEILFIGDTIYTDIRLAEESGFKSCLVLSGNSNKDTHKSYINEPDLILNSVSELFNNINLSSK